MGFGHRVYKTYDPRARALGHVAAELAGEESRRIWDTGPIRGLAAGLRSVTRRTERETAGV
jgi:citrate synthase